MSHAADISDQVIRELRAENAMLRQMLWVWHRSPSCVVGPMFCDASPEGHPIIDFKRDAAQSIEQALQAPSLRFIQEHQDDRCRHCGAGRWTLEAAQRACTAPAHEWMTPSKPEGTE